MKTSFYITHIAARYTFIVIRTNYKWIAPYATSRDAPIGKKILSLVVFILFFFIHDGDATYIRPSCRLRIHLSRELCLLRLFFFSSCTVFCLFHFFISWVVCFVCCRTFPRGHDMKKRRKKRKHVYTRRPLRLIQCCDEQEKDVGICRQQRMNWRLRFRADSHEDKRVLLHVRETIAIRSIWCDVEKNATLCTWLTRQNCCERGCFSHQLRSTCNRLWNFFFLLFFCW